MEKTFKILLLAALSSSAITAVAADQLNDVRRSVQGVKLALVGQARLEVPNDEARLVWTAAAQAATLQEATAQAIQQMNGGIDRLKSVIAPTNLQTRHVNSYPVYSETVKGKAPRIVAWRVTQSVSVTTLDVTVVPTLITTVDGVLELDQLDFSVSDQKRRSLEKTLIEMAINDATKRAGYTAQALGLEPARVQLSDLAFDGADIYANSNRILMRATAKATYDSHVPVPQIEVGTTTLNMTVKANALIH